MIILNEKEYVDRVLTEKNLDVSKAYLFLRIYARYLYHENGLRKSGIIQKLDTFMQENYPNYNGVDWAPRIEKYANHAGKYPLCKCDGIWITKKELETIEGIGNKVLERLAFTLLCLAKFGTYRNPDTEGWISYSNGEIFSLACINTSAFEKDMKIHALHELGLIAFAKKVDNLGIQVRFMDDKSENILFVSDFRKLGYEWKLYKGEKYIRCATCGILTLNTNGRRKYCKDCAENQNRIKVLQKYYDKKISGF